VAKIATELEIICNPIEPLVKPSDLNQPSAHALQSLCSAANSSYFFKRGHLLISTGRQMFFCVTTYFRLLDILQGEGRRLTQNIIKENQGK